VPRAPRDRSLSNACFLPQDYRKRLKRNLEELKQCDRGRTDLDATDIEPPSPDDAGTRSRCRTHLPTTNE
jgi:hypothetical protein